jgi:hypothetical protein
MGWRSHVVPTCVVVLSQLLAHSVVGADDFGLPTTTRNSKEVGPNRPESIVLNAIRAKPLTAPYPINATWRDGAVVLSGRVGTTQIHDAAIRTAIDLGYPIRNDLVIDTAEATRAALICPPTESLAAVSARSRRTSSWRHLKRVGPASHPVLPPSDPEQSSEDHRAMPTVARRHDDITVPASFQDLEGHLIEWRVDEPVLADPGLVV